jgi:hypothetical protein
MTDARLRGEWIGKIKFDNLTDTAWRMFTLGLMWSAEQGTDGHIPARYLRTLHPDGEQPHAIQQIAQAGFWEIITDGVQFIDWDGRLGQSTSLQVETNKANARERQRAFRERERMKLAKAVNFQSAPSESDAGMRDVTRDVTSSVTHDVGKGKGEGSGQEGFPGNEVREVLTWPVVEIPTEEWGDPSAPGNAISPKGAA